MRFAKAIIAAGIARARRSRSSSAITRRASSCASARSGRSAPEPSEDLLVAGVSLLLSLLVLVFFLTMRDIRQRSENERRLQADVQVAELAGQAGQDDHQHRAEDNEIEQPAEILQLVHCAHRKLLS